jgi:hypothetical protein
MKDSLQKILKDICAKHDSKDIAADMVALFEDIRKFFSDNDKDCIDFESLTPEAQEALYEQINLLIELLKQMRSSADKIAVMEAMSKVIVNVLSKRKEQAVLLELDKRAQAIIKQRFADIVFLDLYHKRRAASLNLHLNQIPKPLLQHVTQHHKRQSRKNTGLSPMR